MWTELPRIWLRRRGAAESCHEVERGRAYRDRLVLKLRGVDDASAAAELRGAEVLAASADAPELEEGEYYAARLVGMTVVNEADQPIGVVEDLLDTGGVDLLVVTPSGGAEDDAAGTEEPWMIPMAREIVLQIDDDARRIVIRPPDGLLELNRDV
jgi:16S rRNA processing protein RimM